MAKIATKTTGADFVRFQFEDENQTTVVVSIKDLPENILHSAMLHGLSQKLGDAYAANEGVEDAINKFNTLLDSLKEGNWNPGRTGETSQAALIEAFSRAVAKPLDECKDLIEGMDKERIKALRKHPDIQRALTEIKLEKLKSTAKDAKPLDLDALLGGSEE